MTIDINLDGVEEWKGGGVILGPGSHVIEVTETDEGESANGNPQFILQMVAVTGEEQGSEIRDWITVIPPGPDTKGTFGKVKAILLAFGASLPAGNFKLDPTVLKGRKCKIVVRRGPKNDGSGDTRTVVKAYQALDDTEKVAAEFNATEVKGGGDPGPHPDIPF